MAGFHVVNIAFDSEVRYCHNLFYKKHVSQDGDECTLFIMNIPPYCNEDSLKKIFKDCGIITSVIITQTPNSLVELCSELKLMEMIKGDVYTFKFAYLTFKEKGSLDVALQMSSSDVKRYLRTDSSQVGMTNWIKKFDVLYPKESFVQSIVNEYMLQFDLEEAKKEDKRKQQGGADDEGWITIPVKKKQSNDTALKQKIIKKIEKKKRNEKELKSFYLFQQREEKREKIATMRQKFEEDKKRITQMRQQRKFKPF